MAQASSKKPAVDEGLTSPKKGERFRCDSCGMEIEVTKDCGCDKPGSVHFHCCNAEMQRA